MTPDRPCQAQIHRPTFTHIWLIALTIGWWLSFHYVLETRPLIRIIPDKLTDQEEFLKDCEGYDYPTIRIYNSHFWNNFPSDDRLPFFEPDSRQSHYWQGRITDMDGFLTNHGRFSRFGKDNPKWLDQTSLAYCQQGIRKPES